MSAHSKHLSAHIARSPKDVYDYASNPANLAEWAAGLAGSIENVNGLWISQSPMGRVTITFVAHNTLGVLDHHVELPSGDVVYNPMRVIADGDGSEVIFTLRRQPWMSDADFAKDEAAIHADLATLERLLEKP